jgi:integrase
MDLEKINEGLQLVKLRVKGNRFYLRAKLPPKPGDGLGFKRYELATGFPVTEEGLQLARVKAFQVEADLIYRRFDWSNYLGRGCSSLLLGEWLDRFAAAHWDVTPSNVNTREIYDLDYGRPFGFLPLDAELGEDILRRVLLTFSPCSRDRLRAYVAFSALANFAGVELSKDFKRLRGDYQPRERFIPSDDQILDIWHNWRGRSSWWRWAYGVLAVYGLRPHELFFLDASGLSDRPYILRVLDGKTGGRVVYPVYGEWVGLFGLAVVPDLAGAVEGRSRRALGRRVSERFLDLCVGFVPYALRDRYAVRCAECGIDSSIAARWMGHSLAVHAKYYQRYIDELAMSRVWLGKFGGSF